MTLFSYRNTKKVRDYPWIIQKLIPWYREILYVTGRRSRSTASQRAVNEKLYFGVEYVYGAEVEGDIAEFGTMTGFTAQAIAHAIGVFGAHASAKKNLLLFDSFSGLPEVASEVDKNSLHVQSGTWEAGTCYGVTEEELWKMCRKWLPAHALHIYSGLFKETLLSLSKDTKLAMLHIDSDLYESARDVLEYVFSHGFVQEGCVIFFDDWNCNRSSPDRGEQKAWAETVQKFSISATDCGEYAWSARKFIIHSYTDSRLLWKESLV